MADDRPEDTGSLPDSDRPKRAPPTIDLKATEVSSATAHAERADAGATAPESAAERRSRAVAAVAPPICAGFALDRCSGLRRGRRRAGDRRRLDAGLARGPAGRAASAAAQCRCDRRSHRARRGPRDKSRQARRAVADPAAAARIEALEKSLAALRGDLARRARKAKSWPRRQ